MINFKMDVKQSRKIKDPAKHKDSDGPLSSTKNVTGKPSSEGDADNICQSKGTSQERHNKKRKSHSKSHSPHRTMKKQKMSSKDKDSRSNKNETLDKSKSKSKHKGSLKKGENKIISEDRKSRDGSSPRVDDRKIPVSGSGRKIDESVDEANNRYFASDNESELNLEKPMRRISDYIDDKKELCHQTFKTLRGKKLRGMIPEVLRPYSLNRVHDMCLRELEGMSKKRILRILNGDKPEVISSSSSSSSDNAMASTDRDSECASNSSSTSSSALSKSGVSSSCSSDSSSSGSVSVHRNQNVKGYRKHRSKVKKKRRSDGGEKSSTPEAIVDSTCKFEEPITDEVKVTENEESVAAGVAIVKTDGEKKEEGLEDQDILVVSADDLNQDFDSDLAGRSSHLLDQTVEGSESAKQSSNQENESAGTSTVKPRGTRTLMEIFELEMRARAIRSMLKAQEAKDPRLRRLKNT